MIEQAETLTEQYGHDANLYFVKQASSDELLSGIRAAYDRDMFVTCGCLCLCNGACNTVGDEGKLQRCVFSFGHFFWNIMSQDKDWHLKFVIREIPLCHVIGPSAHHHCPGRFYCFLKHLSFS